MTVQIREAVTEAPVKRGNRWRVVVAKPGQGSSGFYSEEMFKRDATKVVPKGGHCFINHDASRNPKDLVGVYREGSWWDEDQKAVVSELEVFSHWEKFVEEVGPHLGVSLYASGDSDAQGNITEIFEDRLNGADLVARPGLVGSGLAEQLFESARAQTEEKPGDRTSAQDTRKETQVMDAEVKEAFDTLTKTLASLVERLDKADEQHAQVVEADQHAEKAVAAFAEASALIEGADLFDSQKTALREAALKGEDITVAVETAKTIHAEAVASLAESKETAPGGRPLVETGYTGPTAWGNR